MQLHARGRQSKEKQQQKSRRRLSGRQQEPNNLNPTPVLGEPPPFSSDPFLPDTGRRRNIRPFSSITTRWLVRDQSADTVISLSPREAPTRPTSAFSPTPSPRPATLNGRKPPVSRGDLQIPRPSNNQTLPSNLPIHLSCHRGVSPFHLASVPETRTSTLPPAATEQRPTDRPHDGHGDTEKHKNNKRRGRQRPRTAMSWIASPLR